MKKEKCCVKGCDRPLTVYKHGLCRTHYIRLCRTGDVGTAKIRTRKSIKPYKEKANAR